jgi:hypothetical protein
MEKRRTAHSLPKHRTTKLARCENALIEHLRTAKTLAKLLLRPGIRRSGLDRLPIRL